MEVALMKSTAALPAQVLPTTKSAKCPKGGGAQRGQATHAGIYA